MKPINYSDMNELKKYLNKVKNVFNIEDLLSETVTENVIKEYYDKSNSGYKLFHSKSGSIHMALNFDKKFNKQGYYGQSNIINNYIKATDSISDVLELASGNGFNSIFLATENKKINFTGIDLTDEHVRAAQKRINNLTNIKFIQGNFQNLEFPNNNFDLIFEIESICHATDMKKALTEAYRVLRPDKKLYIFDGFRNQDFENFSSDLQLAGKLTELSMAVGSPWKIDKWLDLCEEVGFEIESVTDLSDAIMPNLNRFQFLARGFFKFPKISKFLLNNFSEDLIQNAIAGILMPFTIGSGMQKYIQVVLRKVGG
jgi:ubiquinone/menaquinone biosynthesis C-methylase UbiE